MSSVATAISVAVASAIRWSWARRPDEERCAVRVRVVAGASSPLELVAEGLAIRLQ